MDTYEIAKEMAQHYSTGDGSANVLWPLQTTHLALLISASIYFLRF